MAHYRVGARGFPVADALIPPGSEIDTNNIAWSQLANLTPPIDAQALDDATYQLMRAHYSSAGIAHLMGPPPPASTSSTKRK